MLRIETLEGIPRALLSYRTATSLRGTATTQLPLIVGALAGLPPLLDGIVLASDLQGRLEDDRLLGLGVPDWLGRLAAEGVLPPLDRLGACLCGDLYARPGSTRKGGTGDVREVWRAFGSVFRWVVGVAGNHDAFGDGLGHLRAFRREEAPGFLDASVVERDGLRIAGVSGVIGNPRKSFRRPEGDYLSAISGVLASRPDLLLLHEGPDAGAEDFPGQASVRALLERQGRGTLVACGHKHWPEPYRRLTPGCEAVNVDARVVALLRAEA